jgi:hypothetical protein
MQNTHTKTYQILVREIKDLRKSRGMLTGSNDMQIQHDLIKISQKLLFTVIEKWFP